MNNQNQLLQLLSLRLKDYDAIVVGEDKKMYIAGIIPLINDANINFMLPIYIAQTTRHIALIKTKLETAGIRVIYILDNRYTIEENEPTGEELIKLWHIENDSVLITSSHCDISQQNPGYPVFDKIMPVIDPCEL
ncbi:hypothetical protein [Cysteiniphilum litorale]|uniref:hypothetical protein n=1 Tax=Cysteiniphilum litorale TaxID=2056700 RepID=UPI003F880BD0